MADPRIEIWSQIGGYRRNREVVIISRYRDGREMVADPLVFTDATNKMIDKPTISDGAEFLQAVLDHAWSLGMRPAGFNDTTEQVKAIRDHLNDMRALVFHEQRVILPMADWPREK